jgi:hypothetical protein
MSIVNLDAARLGLPHGSPPELIEAIEQAAHKVLDLEGLSAFEMPRPAAVSHEAGHCIVAAHEGITPRRITVFAQTVCGIEAWGGNMETRETFTTTPDTNVEDDLRWARCVIAGLAGEVITRLDKPGSSLDEVALSQLIAANAATKTYDHSQGDAAYSAYAQNLWHERVWGVALTILIANRDAFWRLGKLLHREGCVKGGKLRKILADVRRISP